jgi:PAS domain S-box-containing protein
LADTCPQLWIHRKTCRFHCRKFGMAREVSKTRAAVQRTSCEVCKNLDGPDDILQLHEISTLLIQEGKLESLYDRILDAAMNLMASDMASMQSLDPEGKQLLQLASIVESSIDSIITLNLDGVITSWNRSAQGLFGYTAEEVIGKPVTILIPLGRHDEERAILERIRRGERIEHYETVRRRRDGNLIHISLTVSPIKNAQGEIIGASKIARDITERKRNDERVAMLAHEAEHRARNILATVQATVRLSQSDTPDGLKDTIEARIGALARVHALFVESRWLGAELSSIAGQELAPYLRKGERRARIDGPHLMLAPSTAQAVAVILHELSTNAAKHGSLSVPEGQVDVTWSRAPGERLILNWIESGGPPPAIKPTRESFGMSIMYRMIGGLKGEIHRDWRAQGLACQIVLQL